MVSWDEVPLDKEIEIPHIRKVLGYLYLWATNPTTATKQDLLGAIDAYRADLQAAADEHNNP